MSYVRSNGAVGRAPTAYEYYRDRGIIGGPVQLVKDIFWGVLDIVTSFIGSLLDPSKPIPKRPKPPAPQGNYNPNNVNRGPNIRSIPRASQDCSSGT